MFNALKEQLDSGSTAALLMGSDCLELSPQILHAAEKALDESDLVLAPALDGGYTLIGCRKVESELFSNILWSTGEVLEKTLVNARKSGLTTSLLESMRDIDTLEDLRHYPELLNLVGLSRPER